MYASDLKHPCRTLEEKLHTLYNLRLAKKIDLSFRPPYLELLQQLGSPHSNLPPVIHVAGTNGKGSIIAMLRAILEQGGRRVHAYTSPHLCRFNERIVLAGQEITDTALEALIDEALTCNKGAEVTFFEITTAMAFAAFARNPADIVLLETGLGGRLDCTNVIEKPAISVIASISRDHTEFLGDSLQQIAAEKAGIIKTGRPCVIAPQTPQALAENVMGVFEERAAALNAPLYRHGHEWQVQQKADRLSFIFGDKETLLPLPSLPGAHQTSNAGAALAALHVLHNNFHTGHENIAAGLQQIQWRGRLQDITKRSKQALPPGWQLWLDVGHNEGAAQILARQAQEWRKEDEMPLFLVVGMLRHKDPRGFLTPLLEHTTEIHIMDIPDEPNSYSAAVLAQNINEQDAYGKIIQAGSFSAALKAITANHRQGRILIAGSVYLAGHILREHCYND
jgi:dihydrofolate synthase/folylpolyglutamate synthase